MCSKYCNSKEDAEEVVQNTFLIAYKKADSLRGDTLVAYLRKIAIHECYRKRNKNSRLQEHFAPIAALLLMEEQVFVATYAAAASPYIVGVVIGEIAGTAAATATPLSSIIRPHFTLLNDNSDSIVHSFRRVLIFSEQFFNHPSHTCPSRFLFLPVDGAVIAKHFS